MKVNLGCGRDLRRGWMNIDANYVGAVPPDIDYIEWNLKLGFPEEIPYGGVSIFYSSHFLEHLVPQDIQTLMTRCYKMLKPGGRFYAEIPDFPACLDAYVDRDYEYFNHPSLKPFAPNGFLGEYLGYALHQVTDGFPEHVSFLDNQIMVAMLKKAGFTDPHQTIFDPEIGNPNPLRQRYSAYYEAIK